MKRDTERRLQALEEDERQGTRQPPVIVYRQGGVIYDRQPWQPDAVVLTADELPADPADVLVIEYVDDWRGEHETGDKTQA